MSLVKTLEMVRLHRTPKTETFIKEHFVNNSSDVSPIENMLLVAFNARIFIYFRTISNSPKHQPLVTLKQLKDLMLLPTGEARLEYCKSVLKRNFL